MLASVLALATQACSAVAQDVVIQGQARVAYVSADVLPEDPGTVIRPPVPATVGQLIDFQITFFPPWSVYAPFPYYSADVVAKISGETLVETAIPVFVQNDVMSGFPLLLTPGLEVDADDVPSDRIASDESRGDAYPGASIAVSTTRFRTLFAFWTGRDQSTLFPDVLPDDVLPTTLDSWLEFDERQLAFEFQFLGGPRGGSTFITGSVESVIVVPEPSSAVLAACATFGVFARRRDSRVAAPIPC